jgi:hypothetical protein
MIGRPNHRFDDLPDEPDDLDDPRRLAVARMIVDVGRLYGRAFEFKRELYPSKAVDRAFSEAEFAFSESDYDKAEHLTKVIARMIGRDAPRFAADPKKWIATRKELQT